jgi:hypothetical protein
VTPFIPQLNWDLGEPTDEPRQRGNTWSRTFNGGWAAVNFNSARRRKVTYDVPEGLYDVDGAPAPHRVTLHPHHGVLYITRNGLNPADGR